ncbi:MAG: hypothetical protein RIQ98_33 [Bacteroidota bacterium]
MLKSKKYDLIIVGAGVTGTFCALHALGKKKSVLLIEKDDSPFDSSLRNMGHINPSAQSLTKWFDISRKSIQIYQNLQENFDLTYKSTGTWYVATNQQELTILEELNALFRDRQYSCEIYTASECIKLNPTLIRSNILGGLYFPNEGIVDAKEMIHRIRDYLIKDLDLHYKPNTTVIDVEKKRGIVKIITSHHDIIWSDHIIITGGQYTNLLLPDYYPTELLQLCQSQIIKLYPQSQKPKTPSITTSSIKWLESSQSCPSVIAKNITREPQAEMVKLTINQIADGSVIIGEALKFGSILNRSTLGFEISMKENMQLIDEAKTLFHLDNWQIEMTWNNTYLEYVGDGILTKTVDEVIHILAGMGQKSLSTAPAFTQSFINQLYQK